MLGKSVAVTVFYRYAFFIINPSAFVLFLYNIATHVTTVFFPTLFSIVNI